MKHTLFTLITATLLLTCCGKSAKETTITGQVRTFGTQEAIRHDPVKVQILQKNVATGGMGGGVSFVAIAEIQSDPNGNFSLTATLHPDIQYYLAVDPETVKRAQGYYKPTFGNIDRPERLITKVGGTHNMNYYLTALGWVKFNIIVSSHGQGDYFAYNLGGGASERFYGNVQVVRKWDFGGNLNHNAAFTVYKNGDYTFWQDQIFVQAFDTIDYNINL